MDKEKFIIIGAGIGGLATACLLSKKGHEVIVIEKNDSAGGRAGLIIGETSKGKFVFDKGPSWYMMPDVFEEFYKLIGEDINEHLKLKKLSPSYRVFMEDSKMSYDFYGDIEKTANVFESIEKGSGNKLIDFLKKVKYQYEVAKGEFMYKNYDSLSDFFNFRVMTIGAQLPIFKKQSTIINKIFKDDVIRKVMQYQTVLLGTSPYETPGIYTLMNYVDFGLGVWYPEGGIYEIIKSLHKIALKNGVKFMFNSPVKKILTKENSAYGVMLENNNEIIGTKVISNADYHHTETMLLESDQKEYSQKYWEKRTLAPSAFILYLGIDGKIPNIQHHNLVFSKNWKENFDQIFKSPSWPNKPSMYICAPSVTDKTIAPENTENLFVLVPIASGLYSDETEKEKYCNFIIERLSEVFDSKDLKERILYKKIYSVEDFESDYNSYKGSALGLAHTLLQTAVWRPKNASTKVKNLYYVGANVNPGIGMPICLISAILAYKRIFNIKDNLPPKTLD
ncbi:MAG TPA: phytoene desaturase family protein [Candidatus Paceibacterota bacterium]|nr:phytoene desaturase family protein [Candidatus Paceibacterota bacterium]